MNPLFSRMTKRYTPPMNRRIMENLSMSSLKYIEEYLDAQIKSVCQGLPDCLKYIGYRRCTSQEEYEEIAKARGNKRNFDIAHSSVYLVNYYFVFTDQLGKDHEIIRPIYLPYAEPGGIISISGSRYHIVPVLSDKVFTPGNNSIFVRLTQDRNNMYRMYHTVVIDGRRESRYVVYATIYRNTSTSKATLVTKAETILVHYLLGKYGFTKMFQRYTGVVPVYGLEEHFTEEAFPSDEWIVCKSRQRIPSTCLDKSYQPTNIAMAVKRKDWTPEIETLIMGFYYIVDHFPDRFMLPKMKDVIDSDGVVTRVKAEYSFDEAHYMLKRYFDDVALWKILVGLIRFGNQYGEHKLHKDVSEHFESLDAYLDTMSKEKLLERGIELENYFDLLFYLSVNMSEMVLEGSDSGLNVYGKNLEILYYILYNILYGFTTVKFTLNKIASRRPLTKKDVESTLMVNVSTGSILKIHSGKIITKSVSYSGDHMYPGVTSVIAEQENRAGADRGDSGRVTVGPQNRLDISMITTGSVLNLPKGNPTPLARVNPWIKIDDRTGTVLENPKFKELIDKTRPLLKL